MASLVLEDNEQLKKRKFDTKDLEIDDPLRDVIAKVGEKMTSSNLNLEQISNVIKKEYNNYKESILLLILKCSLENPEKLTCYSTLVGLLNVSEQDIGLDYLNLLISTIKSRFIIQNYEECSYLMIILSDLINVNVLQIDSYLIFLEYVLKLVNNDNPPLFKDWIINTILHCYPYVAEFITHKKIHKNIFNKIYRLINDYMNSRNINQIRALRIWTSPSTDELKQNEEIVVIWEIIQKMEDDHWKNDMINRLYDNYESILSKGHVHKVENFNDILENYKISNQFPFPRLIFRLFTSGDTREPLSQDLYFPPNLTYHRHYAERIVITMINLLKNNKKQCAKNLLELNLDKTVCLKYIITEVIFGQMLSLPQSTQSILYYGSLLIELCYISSKSFPIIIAQSVQVLFSKLEYMNIVSQERFALWFSNHLSNFQLKWIWDEWESYMINYENNSDQPNLLFLKELVCKLHRLFYNEKLVNCLPSYMSVIFPVSNKHNFHYDLNSDNSPYTTKLVNALIEMIKSSQDYSSIINLLNSNINDSHTNNFTVPFDLDDEDHICMAFRVHILMETLLLGGQKSISHTFGIISKYSKVIKDIVSCQEAEIYCLKTVHEFWIHNQIRIISSIDLLLRLRLVSCYSVVNWIFGQSMQPYFMRFYIWEILENLLKRTINFKKEPISTTESNDYSKTIQFKYGENLSVKNCTSELTIQIENSVNNDDSDVDIKRLLLLIIQHFIMILNEKANLSKKNMSKLSDRWFLITLQRLQHVIISYANILMLYVDTLDVIFTDEIDEHVIEIHRRFKSLCC